MLGDTATIKFRMSNPIVCLSHGMLSLKRVTLIAHRRVWGRMTYLYSTLHMEVEHSTKATLGDKLINQRINETLRQFPKVTPPNQMIDVISPRNLFNKWNQFNRNYAALPESLNRLPEYYNLGSTNNRKKWDATRVKSGRLTQGSPSLSYHTTKMTTSHAWQKPKLHTTYPIHIDTPCLPTQTDGPYRCRSKWILLEQNIHGIWLNRCLERT